MKYVDRSLKGTFGYIRSQTRFEIIKTIILYAMAFGIFFIGIITFKKKENLCSVLAVLAMLPACKSMVGVIMFARFRSLSDESYRKYLECTHGVLTLFENILTTREKTFFVPVMCIREGNVFCYCPESSETAAELKNHMDNVFKNAGYKFTFKVFNDEMSFINRANSLSVPDEIALHRLDAVANTIKAVSL